MRGEKNFQIFKFSNHLLDVFIALLDVACEERIAVLELIGQLYTDKEFIDILEK